MEISLVHSGTLCSSFMQKRMVSVFGVIARMEAIFEPLLYIEGVPLLNALRLESTVRFTGVGVVLLEVLVVVSLLRSSVVLFVFGVPVLFTVPFQRQIDSSFTQVQRT